jgi:hypothetical protein
VSSLSIAPPSLSMFAVALLAGKRAGKRRPSAVIRFGFALLSLGLIILIPIVPRADSGWGLTIPLLIAGSGLGLLVSQLNNYTLAPISEERVSEAAGVNSAAGSFGLAFGLAFAGAIVLATLSLAFTTIAENSAVLSPAEQQRVSTALEDDAELLSNTQLEEVLVVSRRTCRPRSSGSTPTPGSARSRSRSWSRSWPPWRGCSTRSGCCGSPSPNTPAR